MRVGEVAILQGLSLALERPGIYCMIGPNGAGKTSTFNMLTGELPAQAGHVALDGRALGRLPTHRIMRLGVGRKFQIPRYFPALTIADNLAIALWSGRASRLDLLRPRSRRWTSPVLEALAARYPFLADRSRAPRRSSRTASGRSSSCRWRSSASRACFCSTSPAPGFRRRRRCR